MLKLDNNKYLFVGVSITIISFIIFFIGVKVVLGNQVTIKNLIAYMVFSLLVGALASSLIFFKLKIGFVAFVTGLVIGFFQMYRAFLNGLSGWGDLVGVMLLGVWVIIGLVIGMLIQLGFYLYKRVKTG